MQRPAGFTLLEVAVLLTVLVIAVALVIPLGGSCGRSSRFLNNSTQLRGIQQGLVIYAQGNKIGGGKGYFPGLMPAGEVYDAANYSSFPGPTDDYHGTEGSGIGVSDRFALLLNRDSFTPDYAISPFDNLQPAKPGDQLVTDDATGNVSYAMLSIAGDPAVDPTVKARRDEWSETLSPDAIVVSDRLVGNVASGMRSVITGKATSRNQWGCARSYYPSNNWMGGIVRNDGSTETLMTHEATDTKYGRRSKSELDHLFVAGDPALGDAKTGVASGDTLMVYDDPWGN